ncbi:unnamed protein product [Caenorhabditis nigoni]
MKETAFSMRSDIKVMFSVGSDSTAFHFSKIVAEKNKRRFLINAIISFLDEHDLDGVDVFWIWPSKNDRRSYIKFLRELRNSLAELKSEKRKDEDYIISIIAPRNPSEFGGFNLAEIMEAVDFINVLTTHKTTPKIGPLSPLYGGTEGNVDETMKYLSCKTENSRKLNLGVSFYGFRYLNTDLPFGNDSIWIPKSSETKGPFGVTWYEITSDEKSKAKWDNISKTPYIWNDRKFLTFENERSIREKMKYAEDHNIGGILTWVIDQDDEENTLLNVVSSVDLCRASSLKAYNCVIVFHHLFSTMSPATILDKKPIKIAFSILVILIICGIISFALSTTFWYFYDNNEELPCRSRVVGYYSYWETNEVTLRQLRKLTHVIFVFLDIDENGSISFIGDSEKKFLQMKETALSIRSEIKLMFSVGSSSGALHFSKIVADRKKRRSLINSIISFLDENDLDGVDVYWTWPYKNDRRSYIHFLRELRKSLAELKNEKKRAEDYIISIIVPQNPSELEGFNLVEIMESVDFINVLSYDYYYTTHKVGPRSPLYGGSEGNVDETMKFLSCKTENSRKLNMGVTFYGARYLNTDLPFGNNNFWISISSETKGPFGVRWNEITPIEKAITKWDDVSRTSYVYDDRKFVTFENERSIREKMKYAEDHNIGGISIWVIDEDDDENTLLNVVSTVNLCSGSSFQTYNCGE